MPKNVIYVVAVTVTVTVVAAVTVAQSRSRRSLALLLLYFGLWILALGRLIRMTDNLDTGHRTEADFFILILLLLPLFNALFDFASTGLTRYLLRMGLDQKRAAWRAVLDALGGIVIFFALGCTLIAFFTFVTPADGVPFINLAQLFADLRSAPSDYIWLMIALFSTLLPNLLHLSLAVLTLALQYPAWWRNIVAGLLESGAQSGQAALFSSICICAMVTLAFWIPIWLIAFALSLDHGATLHTVLWIFETFAWAIGGI